ncbi:GntR family transcriptional regulator [Kocuria sp. LUK]|uniref:GntR family transcriptional regulator n=1 Tax=Kocuria TaxID=57493 RepID=UPI001E2B6907|nr:GntR family transcriptional regulator [Kocuria sp. LUK]MCD1144504.1 GntR family transcriptional regulator [Kocuria sp. LUK]
MLLQHDDATEGGRSLADQAFLRLQDRLILLDIPPGSPLNEARLSEEMGVGRTPLREALKRLESEHLVVTYPRRGTFATTVDITALSEISQVREVLEPLAARLAAERHGGAARERLLRLRDQLEQPAAEEREDTLRWDVAIHRAVYAAAGNAHLETTLTRYGNLATRIWCVAADRIPQLQEHIAVHTALLTAVLEGRDEEAATIMLEHIRDFEEQVRKVL